ncbi:MAG: bifunctional DNA-formamidopyrimidine glycosylase/DNA-(apurinic or apyrimidinic site) lyase [Verrucomicrobiota bacterium]
MPELPEVETVKRALNTPLRGAVIQRTVVRPPRLRCMPEAAELDDFSRGCRIIDIRRRGKYLILELEDLKAVLIHLGMTGNIRIENRSYLQLQETSPHDHVFWELTDRRTMVFRDSRRFGMVITATLDKRGAQPSCLNGMGPEPFSDYFHSDYLYTKTRNSRRTIKETLMDQSVVAGIGNIYASEILFKAGVNPVRKAGAIGRERYRKIVAATRDILKRSIANEGTTISDYATVSGEEGRFVLSLQVYGKAGESCPGCGVDAAVKSRKLSGRTTYYCPRCQH